MMFLKLHRIHDSTGHGVHNMILYNIVSHNFFNFPICTTWKMLSPVPN